MQHGKGTAVVLFELLALFLIPPAWAILRQATRKSEPAGGPCQKQPASDVRPVLRHLLPHYGAQASHVLARLWRGELPAPVVIFGVYPITLAVIILAFMSSFWQLSAGSLDGNKAITVPLGGSQHGSSS
jgi:hypothetical protein